MHRITTRTLTAALFLSFSSAWAFAEDSKVSDTPEPSIFYVPVVPQHVVAPQNKAKEVKVEESLADKYAAETPPENAKSEPPAPKVSPTTSAQRSVASPTQPKPISRSEVRSVPRQGDFKHSATAYEKPNAPKMEFDLPENHIFVEPGQTNILKIGQGHLNRLVTPFDNPKIHYVQNTAWMVQAKGNTIYVTREKTKSERATLSLFITNGDDQTTALSVTLWAQSLPPKEYVLRTKPNMNGFGGTSYGSNQSVKGNEQIANQFEMENPFSSMVMDVMSSIAVGDVPKGYSLRNAGYGDERPYCMTPDGVKTSFRKAQIMEGSNLQVFVGIIKNTNIHPIELEEGWCATRDVRAVAFWPSPKMPAGGKAEVYVMRHTKAFINDQSHNRRPSLIN